MRGQFGTFSAFVVSVMLGACAVGTDGGELSPSDGGADSSPPPIDSSHADGAGDSATDSSLVDAGQDSSLSDSASSADTADAEGPADSLAVSDTAMDTAADTAMDTAADALAEASVDARVDAPVDAGPPGSGWTFQGTTVTVSSLLCSETSGYWYMYGASGVAGENLIFFFPMQPTVSATYAGIRSTSLAANEMRISINTGGAQWDSISGQTQVTVSGGKVSGYTISVVVENLTTSVTAPLVGHLACP